MPNTHSTLTSLFSDIADAIRGKTGSSATIVADNFPTAIANIPTGGGSATIEPLSVTANGTYTAPSGVDGYSPITVNVPSSGVTTTEEPNSTGTTLYINSTGGGDVRFIDYDGTILYSYSASEFANLTEMPANPTHMGLTSQGWNWTLSDAKTYVADYGILDIGQMYITDDGKTRIYILLDDSAILSPYLGICPNGTVVVDWGDNTATDTLTGTSLATVKRAQHTYASTGNYVITLTVTSGSFAIYGSSTIGTYLLTKTTSTSVAQHQYQSAIQKVELGANVSISHYAFRDCYSRISITIPSGTTSIGVGAFMNCYSITHITLPSGVTDIGNTTFPSCYSLSSISMPNGITGIYTNTFQYCYSLTRITIPSSVIAIGSTAFNSCTSLTSVIIPNSVTSIGAQAFNGCYNITTIRMPSRITYIDPYAFQNCYSLANITIPSEITTISNYTFSGCSALTSITIPNSVTSIGTYAFTNCRTMTSITIPNGVTSIAASTFNYCYALSNINLPNGITSIGASAFANCVSLSSLTIPSGVTSIDGSAFNGCHSLASITIPNGITSINANTFQNCYTLASLTIPSGVTSIGASAFYACGVIEYHFLPTTPPTLANTNAFYGILTDCKIYVPAESLEAYQTATNWSTYASKMVGE